MSSILDLVMSQVQGGGVQQMSRTLGLDESDVSKVVSGAVPAILGGLSRNAQSGSGAEALMGALDRDHDGSVFDDLSGFLGNAGSADAGAGILKHTFGGKEAAVQNALGQTSGVDAASVQKILAMVAPLILGALGRQKREQGLDLDGLAGMLGREKDVVRQRSPQGLDMLTKILDADGDGSMMDEIAEMGTGLLGSLFKK